MTRWDEPADSTFDPGPLDPGPASAEGERASAPLDAPAAPPMPPTPRADELGRGAGGTVVRGPDRHLPRVVAWKIATGASARARLRHEARALAALDHPAIVAIHDLVEDPATDTLRIALRMVRGETLHTLIRKAPTLAERLRLLRAFLHAVEAVAWAHRAGWVHRDLKPANLMIGELGETQVIDWGLAEQLGDAARDGPGTVAGTLAFMSPEQARGEQVGPAADVWGLGATLFELVAGAPLHVSKGHDGARVPELLDRVRRGARPSLAVVCPEAPPELAAIVERSLAVDPEARYPDAGALAVDLAAFLDGRHVAAHAYSARELLGRFVRAWRLPLGVALAVLVTGAIAFAVAYREIGVERDEAVRAKTEALAAVATRDEEVAVSGVIAARRELADGQRPEAELAAARTLAVRESPEARGVLMALARAPRFERRWSLAPPTECVDVALAPDGASALCGSRESLTLVTAGGVAWTWPAPYAGVAFVDGGRRVLVVRPDFATVVLDARDGRVLATRAPTGCGGLPHREPSDTRVLMLAHSCAELADGARREAIPLCPAHIEVAALDATGRVAAICAGGELVVRAPDGATTRRPSAIGDRADTLLSAVLADPGHLIVGSSVGELSRLDLATGAVVARRQLEPVAPIHGIDASAPRGLVVARVEGQGPLVLQAATLTAIERLPRAEGRYARFVEPGAAALPPEVDLVTYGGALVGWATPSGPPARLDGLGGVTWITPVAPAPGSAERLVVTHDTSASVLDAATGALLGAASWSLVIAKAAVLVGREVRVAMAGRRSGEAMATPDATPDGALTFVELPAARRVALLSGGRMLGSRTGPGVLYWPGPGEPSTIGAMGVSDVAVVDDFAAVLLDRPRVAELWDARGDPVTVGACPLQSAQSVALVPSAPGAAEPGLAVVSPSAVTVLDPADCAVRGLYVAPGSELTRAAATRDGRFLAAGTRAGTIHVWRADGALAATVPIHGGPVTTLTLDAAHRFFVSGAWDGQIAFLAVDVLDRRRAELVADIRHAWLP